MVGRFKQLDDLTSYIVEVVKIWCFTGIDQFSVITKFSVIKKKYDLMLRKLIRTGKKKCIVFAME